MNDALVLATSLTGGHALAIRGDGVWAWGYNGSGGVGDNTTTNRFSPFQVLEFNAGSPLSDDADGDGLYTWAELELGTDPWKADTNGDGISDGVAVKAGVSPTKLDIDGDGVVNAAEVAAGTDPFRADSDSDGVNDLADCFPLDANRNQCPTPTPGDGTPPDITLTEPTNAVLQQP